MSVNYTRINWEDSPSTQTPLNAENLNAMDSAIDDLAGAVNDLDGVADDVEELQTDVTVLKNDITHKPDYIHDSASGSIASFPDGADGQPIQSLVAQIEPVQDLHGYDSPWPAGGGKNLADLSNVSVPASEDNIPLIGRISLVAGTYTLSYTLSKTVTCTRNRPAYQIGSVLTYGEDISTAGRGSWTFTLESDVTLDFRWWYHTVSEACEMSDFQLEKGSVATTFAPYSNICPISGWTGANVMRTGKNLVDIQDYSNTSVQTIVSETTPEFANVRYKGNTQYTISGNVVIDNARAFGLKVVYTNDTSEYLWLSRFGTVSNSVTTASGKTVSSIEFVYDQVQTVTSIKNVMLEEGSTASSYEPYQGDTVSIDWTTEAGTVYGGTLDVTTGVLTVDRKMYAISDGSTSTEVPGLFTRLAFEIPTDSITWTDEGSRSNKLICNEFEESYNDATYNGSIGIHYRANGSHQIMVGFGDIAHSWNEASAWVTAHPIVIVYALAVPVTYQLTPQEVKTVLGQNNIFADTGNVTVQYRADTKLYIDKVLNA